MSDTFKNDPILREAVQKAIVLTESMPYIRKFRDSRIVIKYGGHAMIDAMLKQQVARDLTLLDNVGLHPNVVHGGGPEITSLMQRMGLEAQFHQGQRVTDATTLEITEMVLAGKLNGEIVSNIYRAGGRAVGLSGKDAHLIRAEKLDHDSGHDMGFVGKVESIDSEILDLLNENRFIPVVSPIGFGLDGQTYNINADFVAAEVAIALEARKLVLLTDVRGIMRDPKDEQSLISTIKLDEIDDLINDEVITGGMIPKVQACRRALEGGVRKAHILDGRVPHALLLELFTDEGIGTQFQV